MTTVNVIQEETYASAPEEKVYVTEGQEVENNGEIVVENTEEVTQVNTDIYQVVINEGEAIDDVQYGGHVINFEEPVYVVTGGENSTLPPGEGGNEGNVNIIIPDDQINAIMDEQIVKVNIRDIIYIDTWEDEEMQLAVRVDTDDADVGITYVGQATPGTPDEAPLWRIKRVVENGPHTAVVWSEGTDDFAFVWDDRRTYIYGPQ
jgi:hypothetical protein